MNQLRNFFKSLISDEGEKNKSPILDTNSNPESNLKLNCCSLFGAQKQLLPNPMVIFDIGMHHGHTTKEYLENFSEARIYGFEAEHQNFLSAKKMLKSYQPRLTLIESAVFNVDGKVSFNVNTHDGTHSIFDIGKQQYWAGKATTKNIKQVNSITLDNYCDLNEIGHIDILKMDIQGAELNALKGARKLLSQKNITMIVTEVEFKELYKNQPLYEDLAVYLRDYGYVLVGLYDFHYVEGILSWADAIFLLEENFPKL
jgi:FkbM family methyltransferase